MFLLANKKHNINFKKSVMIGDRYTDYLAAKKTGVKFISIGILKIKNCPNKNNLKSAVKFLFKNKI